MTTKTFHGFTLWAVPRFHRPEAIHTMPFRAEPGWGETATQNRTAETKADATPEKRQPRHTASGSTCH
jgi:hypothetical protein